MASSSSRNICVVCLEPLLLRSDGESSSDTMCDIGTASPCGHLYHTSCWEEWREVKRSAGVTPCPTCQQQTNAFTKIFLYAEPAGELPEPAIGSDCLDTSDDGSDSDENEEESVGNATAETTTPKRNFFLAVSEEVADLPTDSKKRRSKWQKMFPNRNTKKAAKKLSYYKHSWRTSDLRLKIAQSQMNRLKREAEHRKLCHHADLIELERSQLLSFQLAKELEHFHDSARVKRNFTAVLCFGVGILWSKLKLFGIH